ncbi:MAG: hypothetical protein H6926_03550 [Chromatiales bacterium]|nr:hypothetical protein [Chromatiales bacterium]
MNAALNAARAIHLNLILLSAAILVLALPGEDPADYREALTVLHPLQTMEADELLGAAYLDSVRARANAALSGELAAALRAGTPDRIHAEDVEAPRHASNWAEPQFRTWLHECEQRLGDDDPLASMWLRTALPAPADPDALGWPVAIDAQAGSFRIGAERLAWSRRDSLASLAGLIASPNVLTPPKRLSIDAGSLRDAMFSGLPATIPSAQSAWAFHADRLTLHTTDNGARLSGDILPLYTWITLNTGREPNRAHYRSPFAASPDAACVLPPHDLNAGADDVWYWSRLAIDAAVQAEYSVEMTQSRPIDWLLESAAFRLDGGSTLIENGSAYRWSLRASPLWRRIANMNPAEATSWLKDRLDALEADPSVDIFGFHFSGRALLVAAPIAALALLFYLTLHLQAATRRDGDPGEVAWMGVYDTSTAQITTALTLVALPATALFAVAWRFRELDLMWLPTAGGVGAIGLGFYCVLLLGRLRKRA